jgi:prepilin-type N-terminal cleavage/methylation domain-containing protein/prepilin-type processing-associated H-X9-DG protein
LHAPKKESGPPRQLRQNALLHRAFTLTELLVVIAVVAVLISLLMPALAAARRQALDTECLNNLRTLGLAMDSYAIQNNGRLPSAGPTDVYTWWPWDIPNDIVTLIMAEGPTEETFFCPMQLDQMQYWSQSTSYHTSNYFFFMNRSNQSLNALPLPGQTKFMKSRFTDNDGIPDDLELASDAVMSTDDTPTPGGNNFTLTNHLTTEMAPLGGNVLMLDGHVEWRPFAAMAIRTQNGGTVPYFWW